MSTFSELIFSSFELFKETAYSWHYADSSSGPIEQCCFVQNCVTSTSFAADAGRAPATASIISTNSSSFDTKCAQSEETNNIINNTSQLIQASTCCSESSCKTLSSKPLIAAGHFDNFWFDSSSSTLIKKTKTKEVEFYTWLYCLANIPIKISCHKVLPNFDKYQRENIKSCVSGDSTCNLYCRKTLPFILDKFKTLFVGNKVTKNCIVKDIDVSVARQFMNFMPKCIRAHLTDERDIESLCAVELDNLIYGMKSPLVLDIKIGERLYGDEASEEKKQRAIKLALERSHPILGFCLCGMCGFLVDNNYVYIPGGKRRKEGQKTYHTIEEFSQLMYYFISAGEKNENGAVRTGEYLLLKLKELYSLFEKQTLINFYGSSLLFVKDTDTDTDTNKNENIFSNYTNTLNAHVKMSMIDFAHVTVWSNQIDKGYLKGINNLIKVMNNAINIAKREFNKKNNNQLSNNTIV